MISTVVILGRVTAGKGSAMYMAPVAVAVEVRMREYGIRLMETAVLSNWMQPILVRRLSVPGFMFILAAALHFLAWAVPLVTGAVLSVSAAP